MKKGTFVNYQLAEFVLLLLEENISKDEFQIEFNKLKQKWKEDVIPATGTRIPDLFSMQELTKEQLSELSRELLKYDTYTVENSAGMQNVTKIHQCH